MLKNHVTIAWRNLQKHSFYSFINIAGLAIGVAASLVIVLFVIDELGYDRYHAKVNRIYRVEAEVKFGENHFKMTYRPAPEASALMQDYPEIESTVRFRNSGSYLVKAENGTENFQEKNVIWTDSTFFKIFSVNVLEGNPRNALREPASIAISKRIADRYFPGSSALGQSMVLDNKYHAKVTAVYEDMPLASHFHFDILIAMTGDWPISKEARSSSFVSENFPTYLLLKEGTDAKALENKLPGFLEKYLGPQLGQALGGNMSMKKFLASGNIYQLTLRPVTDIHLHSDLKGEFEPTSSITYVYLLSTIAAFILVIACINFMNLSTARSGSRAKEVGVRKVMGSLRSHLVQQFLTESFLITSFSFALSLALAWFFLPVFNNLAVKQLQLPLNNPLFYLVLFSASIFIGLLAGVYPSFFLSAFKPIQVLKGRVSLGLKSGLIRSSLVVFQFVISVLLIMGAITVNRQLAYIQNKKTGFQKDQVIIIHDLYALRPNVQSFQEEVLKLSSVESGTMSGHVPIESDWSARNSSTVWRDGVAPAPESMVSIQRWGVDPDYLKTFGMKILKGRDFSREFPSDHSAVILNETAAVRLGLGEDPIGKKINRFSDDNKTDSAHTESCTVIGIVEDFHFSTMKQGISPLGLYWSRSDGNASFRFTPGRTHDVIESIEKIWKQQAPGQPFQYSFLDEDFEAMYLAEQRLGKIFTVFATLAIIIACLGLFALTAFTTEQRTKEIGIRKVLGATIGNILVLLSKDFCRLIFIAFIISAPVAWYGINWWLQSYAYKTEIGAFVYLLAGAFAFTIALATISYQSIKAAASNPVDSIRTE